VAADPGLKARLFAVDPALKLSEALAGLLDLDAPESRLEAAQQAVASGLLTWAGEGTSGRAAALGLSRRQSVRLRLCACILAQMERESWAMPAPISGPSDVLGHLVDIRGASQERVVALYLDSRNRPLHREVVAIGGLRASVIQPRDILAPAMQLPVAGIILAHNHPSGDTHPSSEDLEVTRQLAGAARLFGIELLDHLVVSRGGYTSLKEMGAI
jgi:DNA repair protein RadC